MTSSNGNFFPRYWPFVWGIHQPPVNSPHKGRWRGALMFSLICAGTNGVNNRYAGNLRRYRVHYDVIVMTFITIFPTGQRMEYLPLRGNLVRTAWWRLPSSPSTWRCFCTWWDSAPRNGPGLTSTRPSFSNSMAPSVQHARASGCYVQTQPVTRSWPQMFLFRVSYSGMPTSDHCWVYSADSRFAPSQCETALLCNDVSH